MHFRIKKKLMVSVSLLTSIENIAAPNFEFLLLIDVTDFENFLFRA